MYAKIAIILTCITCLPLSLLFIINGMSSLAELIVFPLVAISGFIISILLLYKSRRKSEKKTINEMLVVILPAIPLSIASYYGGAAAWLEAGGEAMAHVFMYTAMYVFVVVGFYNVGQYKHVISHDKKDSK